MFGGLPDGIEISLTPDAGEEEGAAGWKAKQETDGEVVMPVVCRDEFVGVVRVAGEDTLPVELLCL